MKVLGFLVALAFIAFVGLVGYSVLQQAGFLQRDPVRVQCLDGSIRETCPTVPAGEDAGQINEPPVQPTAPVVRVARSTAPTLGSSQLAGQSVSEPRCRTIDGGYLEENPIVGSQEASQVHVSYWIPGGEDQRERDVILPGGSWERAAGLSGYFWVFAGCTDEEVQRQVEQHQERRRAEIGSQHAGWGDTSLFSQAS